MPEAQDFYLVDISVTGEVTPHLLDQQRIFLSRLTEQGALLFAGVIPAVKGRGLAIVRAASLEHVREIYADAPVVAAGAATVDINMIRRTAGQITSD